MKRIKKYLRRKYHTIAHKKYRHIIQFWDSDMPPHIQALTQTWQDQNPDFNYTLFNRQTALAFFKKNYSNEIYEAVKDITIPAMFCDVFRVAYILKRGGVYADCATRANSPLMSKPLNLNRCNLIFKANGNLWNGFIASKAGNKFIQALWDSIETTLLKRTEGNLWSLTGPGLVMNTARAMAEHEPDFRRGSKILANELDYIHILKQKRTETVVKLVNELDHKRVLHWSMTQQIQPLFKPTTLLSLSDKDKSIKKALIIQMNRQSAPCPDDDFAKMLMTAPIDQILAEVQSTIQQWQASKADTITLNSYLFTATKDYTLAFNKELMNRQWIILSEIAAMFQDSRIIYQVADQTDLIGQHILENDLDPTDVIAHELNNSNSPLLDHMTFDHGLRYFFPDSILSPQKTTITGPALSDDNKVAIQDRFAASNTAFNERYPDIEI